MRICIHRSREEGIKVTEKEHPITDADLVRAQEMGRKKNEITAEIKKGHHRSG